jgi:hypothetical protein
MFTSFINNSHSFNSYIRNSHSFGVISGEIEPAISWFINIHNKFEIGFSQAVLRFNLVSNIDIKKVSLGFTSSLIKLIQSLAIPVSIKAPVMNIVIKMLQGMGAVDVALPNAMMATMNQNLTLGNSNVTLPSISLVPTITCEQYYMVSYFDGSLLSDLDGILLSEMDTVTV